MKSNIKFLSLLLIVAGMISSCTSSDGIIESTPINGQWKVSIDATTETDATRAISVGGNNGITLYANWDSGDEVEVVKDGAIVGTLTAEITGNNSANAKLNGSLSGTYSVGDELTVFYRHANVDYTGQKGTIGDASTKYAYMKGTTTVSKVDGSNQYLDMSYVSFNYMQLFLNLTFQDNAGNEIKVKKLTMKAASGKMVKSIALDGTKTYFTDDDPLIVTPDVPSSHLFIAMHNDHDATDEYTYIIEDENGQSFIKTVNKYLDEKKYCLTGAQSLDAIPLTIEIHGDGGKIYIHWPSASYLSHEGMYVKYKLNGGALQQLDVNPGQSSVITGLVEGDKVEFFGDGYGQYGYDLSHTGICIWFEGTVCPYIYGNILSLIDPDNYSTLTTISKPYALSGLLMNHWGDPTYGLKNHPTLKLSLPATNLSEGCYSQMFLYSGITTAPVLPAKKLAKLCYYNMFQYCTLLNNVTCLATDISAVACTTDWFVNASTSGTFITPSSTTWTGDTSGIPSGWTRKTP